MLCSAANTVLSVLSMNDWVPPAPSEIDALQHSQQCESNTMNRMKRVLEHTSLCSESAPLGNMDGGHTSLSSEARLTSDCTVSEVEYSAERGSKRQKVQVA